MGQRGREALVGRVSEIDGEEVRSWRVYIRQYGTGTKLKCLCLIERGSEGEKQPRVGESG